MPPWTQVHPLIVHFPIALLMVAPLLVLLGVLWPSQRVGIHFAALVVLILGTLGALLALASGEAASGLAQRTPELRAAVERHEHFAQLSTIFFAGLTFCFAVLWGIPRISNWNPSKSLLLFMQLLWLAASAGAVLTLAITGHIGGRMVHELGIHLSPGP